MKTIDEDLDFLPSVDALRFEDAKVMLEQMIDAGEAFEKAVEWTTFHYRLSDEQARTLLLEFTAGHNAPESSNLSH